MRKLFRFGHEFVRTLDWSEIWRYFITGVFSTSINVLVSFLLKEKFGVDVFVANIIAWILSVTFAFLADSFYVFRIRPENGKEFLTFLAKFYGERIFTLAVEELLFLLFYIWASFPYRIVKIGAQLIVIGSNFLISKFIVFRHRGNQGAAKTEDISEND